MTIRVTSQAELDAALANPDTRHITIDSPEGVWLTLDTDRTDVITDITGKSRLEKVTGSAYLGRMDGSARLRAVAGTPTIHLYGGTVEHAAPHVAVYLHSAAATFSGGHLIDLTGLDLTDVEQWRAHVGADHAIHPDNKMLILPSVSSQAHAGELDRDGRIRIGCWAGTPDELRTLINGDRWPSHADKEDREQYRPRIRAFADLADQQIAAWAAAPKAEAGTDA